MIDAAPGLELGVERVSKRFGETQALHDVSLRVPRGRVLALIGENGAGKSTLGRIVSGVIRPDDGSVTVDGEPVILRSPRSALERGIATIAQELALVPGLPAPENVLLGAEPRSMGVVRRGELRRRYAALADSVGFDLPLDLPVGAMPIAQQQQVEILRALARDAQLIVMDEPSARLSAAETAKLHAIIRAMAERGRSVILISHHLAEVLEVADEVAVLRDGQLVLTTPAADATESSLIEAMLGRGLDAQFPEIAPPPADAPVLLALDALSGAGFREASLEVRAGEIVGLAGLIGAGRSELGLAIIGATRPTSGRIELRGRAGAFRSPREARRGGVMMIPESRRDQGLFGLRPVRENVSIASLEALSRLGVVALGAEARSVAIGLERATVRAHHGLPVSALSGGNQQKLLFARTMLGEPTLLVADEPTRGVDVGAKRAIYELLAALAAEGIGILLISSELEEIIGLSHRVYVMRAGRIVAELDRDHISEGAILAAAFATPVAPSAGQPAADGATS